MGRDLLFAAAVHHRLVAQGDLQLREYHGAEGLYGEYPLRARYARGGFCRHIYSGHQEDKFAETGLTAARSEVVDAPYVQQFPIVLECRLLQAVELGLHTLFIGEIVDVKADEAVLGEHGVPEIARLAPLVFDPGQRGYYQLGGLLGKAFEVGRKEG